MSLQYSATIRNAQLDALESTVGTAPILRLYSGTEPATCATALSGNTLLAEGTLPSDWMAAASAGAKGIAGGPWSLTGQSGAGSGTAATFYRLFASNGTTVHMQGTVTGTGGGGDMTLDNVSIASAQAISVSTFTVTAGNA